jgi:hypothetical protein
MEFCAAVVTLLVDEHGAYDPRLTNDRLLHVITHNANMLGERVQGSSTAARRFWPAC